MDQDILISSVVLNPLIVEKIFQYLGTGDLKSCRKVCKFWNTLGTCFLSEKVLMCLEDSRLDQVLKLFQYNSSAPLGRFANYLVKINSRQSINPTISILWSTIHVNIKFLNLHITTIYALKHLKCLLLLYLPCLETLKLVIFEYWGDGSPKKTDNVLDIANADASISLTSLQISYLGSPSLYGFLLDPETTEFRFPVEWKLILQRYPNMKHFCVVGLCSSDITEFLQMVHLSKHAKLTSLEILDESPFPETPNDDHFRQLLSLQNQFKSLHIELGPYTDLSSLISLISKQTKSLKNLRLRRFPHWNSLPISLSDSALRNIEFLEVSDGLLPNLTILKDMFALRRFHIILRDYRHLNATSVVDDSSDSPGEILNNSVKHLYIEPPLISRRCIEKLAWYLPRLESINLRVDNEMFTQICSIAANEAYDSWKQINDLTVTSWDALTDEGITGISDKALKFWSEFQNCMDLRTYRSSPYIGDLKSLKKLHIEVWPDYDNHISDWSVVYGVADIMSLEQVTFVRCEITSTALSTLHAKRKIISS